ncbi:MAG TPA: hypothetical protein PKE07_07705 [Lacibacter sp.]|nr:hypothetical protein [Lacibacter sp.]HMO88459.1 hypothetical protein [Lacibacter sp.]
MVEILWDKDAAAAAPSPYLNEAELNGKKYLNGGRCFGGGRCILKIQSNYE